MNFFSFSLVLVDKPILISTTHAGGRKYCLSCIYSYVNVTDDKQATYPEERSHYTVIRIVAPGTACRACNFSFSV